MLLLDPASDLHTALVGHAERARVIFVTGLPGTGKSLLIHQLVQLAHRQGRPVSLLQWDVARPAIENHAAARAYPAQRGVTHGVVRVAVGRWARAAVARWAEHAEGSRALLVGEAPLVGHRLVELVRGMDDAAEPVLSDPRTRFVVPVPSRELRRHLEAERARRAAQPLHPREREDAPPEVLQALWRDLAGADVPYDPVLYQHAYERLLRHRRAQALPLHARLPTEGVSAYDFRVETADLVPTPPEASAFVAGVEATHAGPDDVRRAIEGWRHPA